MIRPDWKMARRSEKPDRSTTTVPWVPLVYMMCLGHTLSMPTRALGAPFESEEKNNADASTVEAGNGELALRLGELSGPKKTIAVARFDGHGNFTSHYGGWDTVGGGLAAMLITELTQSGRFIVVDPADMDAVLREH